MPQPLMTKIERTVSEAEKLTPRPHVWTLVGVVVLTDEQAASGDYAAAGVPDWQGPMCFSCERRWPLDSPCPGEPEE